MTSVYSKNLQIFNAEQFKESVSEPQASYLYFMIGRDAAWANEAAPPQANTSINAFYDVWRNTVGAKLVTGNDIRHVIPRHNWTANTVYYAYNDYTDTLDMFDQNNKFYVVTTDYNVYKCIANNYGAKSNVMPSTFSTTGTITEVDGYIWKYMYTISPGEQLKYTTDAYIPVKTVPSDDNSRQWEVQQNAVDGAISYIEVIDGGSGYTDGNNITITITGDGTGANAIAKINTSTLKVNNVILISPGSGYTYATVICTDIGAGTNASFRAIMSPPGGHGSDALRELGGSYLILNPRLSGSEGDLLTLDGKYRQVSLLKDPYKYGTTTVSSNTVVSQLMTFELIGTSVDFTPGETVYQGPTLLSATFKARVIEWDSSNNRVKVSNTDGNPVSGENLNGSQSTATRTINNIIYPDLERFTGRLLYTENIEAVSRNEDQTEDYKIVLKF